MAGKVRTWFIVEIWNWIRFNFKEITSVVYVYSNENSLSTSNGMIPVLMTLEVEEAGWPIINKSSKSLSLATPDGPPILHSSIFMGTSSLCWSDGAIKSLISSQSLSQTSNTSRRSCCRFKTFIALFKRDKISHLIWICSLIWAAAVWVLFGFRFLFTSDSS